MALTNFVSYLPASTSRPRIGHLDLVSSAITPLSYPSGAPLSTLYEVISSSDPGSFIPSSQFQDPVPLSSVTLLPPISGRDVLAVGKNYVEHAREFNSSGYDSSDKVDQPTHPVIFTKRATSVIASGEDIYTHKGWTETLDYEGEIAVILGKEGRHIKEADAWNYVW
jgi:2-keto-4-pentenoate hydratase/2-oxohepta-3-ene-1,7-dioic acid hydratase in catechol pathway